MTKRLKHLRDVMRHLPPDGRVRDVLRKFNLAPLMNGKARSVKQLAHDLGFEVVQVDLGDRKTGRLVQDPFSEIGYRIETNRRHSIQAQRWAVLHEIGHYFLHADKEDPFADAMAFDASGETFYIDQNEEREANEFAATLLFGDGAFAAARGLYGNDKRKLAHHFGVSERVIEIASRTY